MSAFELQVFVSLMTVLGAAFVALVCDVLKGSNEQLREKNIELRVRAEERQKHVRAGQFALQAQIAERAAAPRAYRERRLDAESWQPFEGRMPPPAYDPVPLDVRDVLNRLQRPAAKPRRKQRPVQASAAAGIIIPRLTPVKPAPAQPRLSLPEPLVQSHLPEQAFPAFMGVPPEIAELMAAPVKELPFTLELAAAIATPRIRYRDKVVQMPLPKHPDDTKKPAAATGMHQGARAEDPSWFDLPPGVHDAAALPRLMAEKAPFRGLVVSVAIAGYERLMATQNPAAIGQMMDAAAEALSALARREDFFCSAGGGEFVLVFARENGAAAQRRVAQVAERLWDFQLRSLGSLTIHFNWGVAECNGETFAEGLDSAREQMRESEVRRGGQAPADRPQRAVNG